MTLKENHELIQGGPYRVVRHPIYSGLLLMILGTAILIGRVGGLVVLAFCSCGLWVELATGGSIADQTLSGVFRIHAPHNSTGAVRLIKGLMEWQWCETEEEAKQWVRNSLPANLYRARRGASSAHPGDRSYSEKLA